MVNARPEPTQWPLSITTPNRVRRTPYTPRPATVGGAPYLDRVATPPPVAAPPAPTRHGDPRTQPHPGARHSGGEWGTGVAPRPPAAPPAAPAQSRRRRPRRADASAWHWLLWIPILLPLMPAVYNRTDPTLFGVPFFYWAQLSFAFLASGVIAFVHRKVK
jgi:hypothetical protein